MSSSTRTGSSAPPARCGGRAVETVRGGLRRVLAGRDELVLDGDTTYRTRIAMAGRSQVLDFPGMYLRDLFAEGRHRVHTTPGLAGEPPVVDLRTVL